MKTSAQNFKGATQVLPPDGNTNGFYRGLWYVDIALTNATTGLYVIAGQDTNGNGEINWGNNNQSFAQLLPDFGNEAGDIVLLNDNVASDGGRNSRGISTGKIGLGGSQLAALLSLYNTCDSNNTYGYNAYPQQDASIFSNCSASALSSSEELADYDYAEYLAAGKDYSKVNKDHSSTVAEKIAGLQAMYNANK